MRPLSLLLLSAAVLANGARASAQLTADVPAVRPDAVIDLATTDGVQLVRGRDEFAKNPVACVPD